MSAETIVLTLAAFGANSWSQAVRVTGAGNGFEMECVPFRIRLTNLCQDLTMTQTVLANDLQLRP